MAKKAAATKKTVTKKTAKKKSAKKTPIAAEAVTAQIVVNPSDDLSSIYANHAEVAHSFHEFTIFFGQLPTKASMAVVESVKTTGQIRIEPDAQVIVPPTLIPGLISALEAQLKKYEEKHGIILRKDDQIQATGAGAAKNATKH